MQPKEIEIPIYNNLTIRGLHWHNPKGVPTLALHGWLDNAASFNQLAPLLKGLDLVAIDFSGHGHSDHKPKASFFHILDWVIEGFKVADALEWKQFCLLGHSLGAAIASMMAGTLPPKIKGLILLDGLGALTSKPENAPMQLAQNILSHKKRSSMPPQYKSIQEALEARLEATPMNPAAAKAMIERGTKRIEQGWTWRTDPKLLIPSALFLTPEQTLAFLRAISAPTLMIRPEPGYPFKPDLMQERLACIQKLQFETVKGEHHAHLDSPQEFADLINPYIANLNL